MSTSKPSSVSTLTARVDLAVVMAARLHANQIRKGSEARPVPYIAHLLEVTAVVLSASVPEDIAIAALFHDAPEDQGGRPTLEQIRGAFGERVAGIVEACTDTFEKKKPDWIERKRHYLEKLRGTDDFDVLLIKCADCLSNARATLADYRVIGDEVWKRFKSMPCASNQRWWYASVREAVRPIGVHTRAFAELNEVVEALLSETSPCAGCHFDHLTMPMFPTASEDEDLEALTGGGFDPTHRCPACAHVPLAPGDGLGRLCPNCGNRWMIAVLRDEAQR